MFVSWVLRHKKMVWPRRHTSQILRVRSRQVVGNGIQFNGRGDGVSSVEKRQMFLTVEPAEEEIPGSRSHTNKASLGSKKAWYSVEWSSLLHLAGTLGNE